MKNSGHSVDLSIIIANYNGVRWLTNCLSSIFHQRKGIKYEVIVVDNASTDNSLNIIRNSFPLVKIIQNDKNLGFGRANNIGVKKSKGRILLFLNSDTILKHNFLIELIRHMYAQGLDLAGPKILDFKNQDYYEDRKLTLDIVGSLSWGKKITMIEGCSLAIKKDVFNKLGGFDKDFFMYSEDLDLCWRAWLMGYKIGIVKSAILNHYGGGSSLPTLIGEARHQVPASRRYQTEKNTIKMMLKNATLPHLILALPLMIVLISGESLLYLFTGQLASSTFIFSAIGWNIRNLNKILSERSIIQKNKKKSDIWPYLAKKITKFEVFRLIGIPKIKHYG